MSDITVLRGDLPLGKSSSYKQEYAPELLCAISRQQVRADQAIPTDPPVFSGADLWTAYELSWLNSKGKPQVACGTFSFPCDSPGMIESKSFKLYLNSFNQTRFESQQAVRDLLVKDLSAAAGSSVEVSLFAVDGKEGLEQLAIQQLPGVSIDSLDIEIDCYQVSAALLQTSPEKSVEREALHSHLFKTNCPVTGQPDWASIFIRYSGPEINRESLLRYLCSYRLQPGFHESCTEHIFMDLLRCCDCTALTVEARYLRRGGLDINPFRTNCGDRPLAARLCRQ